MLTRFPASNTCERGSMPLMCLGQFIFELASLPYQSLQHQRAWRHPSNSRVGLRPARQYTGRDDETISLSGVVYHEITGYQPSIDELKDMADTGAAWVLIDADGTIHGCFVIEGLDLTRTVFDQYGAAKKIEFSIKLARVDDDEVSSDTPAADNTGVAL